MTATSQNHKNPISQSSPKFLVSSDALCEMAAGGRGTMADLAIHQHDEEDAQQGIKPHEAEQRKQAIARRNIFRIAIGSAHQPIDEPWLAANLRGHPARRIGD